jgi:hypothetical protein
MKHITRSLFIATALLGLGFGLSSCVGYVGGGPGYIGPGYYNRSHYYNHDLWFQDGPWFDGPRGYIGIGIHPMRGRR